MLVIEQPAVASYVYPNEPTAVFVRGAPAQTFATPVYIGRSRITLANDAGEAVTGSDGKVMYRYVKLNNKPDVILAGSTQRLPLENYNNPSSTSDITVQIGSILRTGIYRVAVPIVEEIHYSTVDELGTITEGSQSFKYYIPQPVEVYDRISMTHTGYTGGFTFLKVDENRIPLAGAKFDLYYGGVLKEKGLVTDA